MDGGCHAGSGRYRALRRERQPAAPVSCNRATTCRRNRRGRPVRSRALTARDKAGCPAPSSLRQRTRSLCSCPGWLWRRSCQRCSSADSPRRTGTARPARTWSAAIGTSSGCTGCNSPSDCAPRSRYIPAALQRCRRLLRCRRCRPVALPALPPEAPVPPVAPALPALPVTTVAAGVHATPTAGAATRRTSRNLTIPRFYSRSSKRSSRSVAARNPAFKRRGVASRWASHRSSA